MKNIELRLGTTHETRKLTSKDAAYLAAFIDGEGTIGIYKSTTRKQNHPYYGMRIQLTNTDIAAIQKLHEMVGAGTLYFHNKQEAKWKDSARLCFQHEIGEQILKQVINHLIIKKAQAELALYFLDFKRSVTRQRMGRDPSSLSEQERCYQEMRKLNARGKKHQKYQVTAQAATRALRLCSVNDCTEKHYGRGYCRKHYKQMFVNQTVIDPNEKRLCKHCEGEISPRMQVNADFCSKACKMRWHRAQGCYTEEAKKANRDPCSVEGCDKPMEAAGMCRSHYMKQWHAKYGRTKSEFWQRQEAEAK